MPTRASDRSGREQDYWAVLEFEASEVAILLPECSSSPSDISLERAALWHVAALTVDCVNAIDPRFEGVKPVPLEKEDAPSKVRWEIESAIHMVPRFGPWSHGDIEVLRQTPPPYPQEERSQWFDAICTQIPLFLNTWRNYVTDGNFKVNRCVEGMQASDDYGQATLLSITAGRLAQGVHVLLEQDGDA